MGANLKQCVGEADVLFITLDTLRLDVAEEALGEGLTPNLERIVGSGGWEARHAPGNFTFASHAAFFAGFLPTPRGTGPHERTFALAFEGSESTGPGTLLLPGGSVPEGFATLGYHTICVGGTGFFNPQNALGRHFPSMFAESHWDTSLGVSCPESPKNQFTLAKERVESLPDGQRTFVFINVSAIHQPSTLYLLGSTEESVETQRAALIEVDTQLGPLLDALVRRAPVYAIVCSDHGTAFGEGGYWGHRCGHDVVWTVPYTERLLEGKAS